MHLPARWLAALTFAALGAACDVDELEAFDDPTDFTLGTCEGLAGALEAVDLRVTATADPTRVFAPDVPGDWRLTLDGDRFTSQVGVSGTTGNFTVDGEDLRTSGEALWPGLGAGASPLACSRLGPEVFLRGPARWDFDGDGLAEPAWFEADLEPVP